MKVDRFEFERALTKRGVARIAGVDEVGRGPLAGPVVAAAVVLPIGWIQHDMPELLKGLNDSKKLSASTRDLYYSLLIDAPEIDFGIAIVDAAEIDRVNILRATWRAMDNAIAGLQSPPDHVLVDGKPNALLRMPQTAVIRGDSLSYSIAAASVLAKVTRDRLMVRYDSEFPRYGFAAHKGYGTPAHLAAISQHGPCALHRRSFAPLKQPEPDLFNS